MNNISPTIFAFFFHCLFASTGFAEPMNFRLAGNGGNCNGCEWIVAEGEITPETPADFSDYVVRNGKPYIIMLNSPGGNLIAGLELGELIREQGATTMIGKTVQMAQDGLQHFEETEPGICASACAFAFMGGVERYVSPDDRLGVHQFYSVEDTVIDSGAIQELAGISLFYTIEMGIDPRVIVAASATKPEEIYWFDQSDLELFGLDTSIENIESWKLEPYKAGVVLTTIDKTTARRSAAVTLFCRIEDGVWRILISEEYSNNERPAKGESLLRFNGRLKRWPKIWLGPNEYTVRVDHIEFERFVDNKILVSLRVPPHVTGSGGLNFTFDPDLARVFNQLISVSVVLPPNSWLEFAKRNCI